MLLLPNAAAVISKNNPEAIHSQGDILRLWLFSGEQNLGAPTWMTQSGFILEVKQSWSWLVFGWETVQEVQEEHQGRPGSLQRGRQ